MKRIGKPQSDSTWQGQLTWHHERARGIGGSEIAAILGESDWMTPFQLWEYKTGKKESKDISSLPHIQRGVLGEKLCRQRLEHEYVPHTWVIEDTPYRCSDDGYSKERSEIIEIKCMSARAHKEFTEHVRSVDDYKEQIKAVPVYYLHQCLWNLFVSNASACRFISFNPEDETMAEVVIKPDPRAAKRYVKAVDKFWKHVTTGLPPPLIDKDQVELQDDAFSKLEQEWVQLKDEVDGLREKLGAIEDSLRGFTEKHPRVKGRLVHVTRSFRAGSVDYQRAFAEARISLDAYRREPIELVRVSRVKREDA